LTCQDCARLQEENTRLSEENQKLRQENAELRRRLAAYENPHTPPSRRLIYPKPQRMTNGPRFPGRPRGHRGVTRPRPHPDTVVEPPRKERCEGCGSPLGEPSLVDHRIVEEVNNPAPRQVIDYLEYGWECGACGSHTSSRHPDCPPLGRLGKNALVQATLLKFQDRLPHAKVCEALERTYGLTVTPATVLNITSRVAGWLRPEYLAVRDRIRASPVVYTDETGEKVDGARHWLWCFTTDTDTLAVVRKSRGKRVLEEALGEDFDGVIVCDGWRSYPSFTDRIQRDWAHLLREAKYLAEEVDEARTLRRALIRLYRDLNTALLEDPPPEERARIAGRAKRRLRRWLGKEYQSVEVKKFVGKVRNGFDHWFTFVTVPGVEPTNNRAERALKEHVVQRKIIGTFRNGKGTWIYETVMTLLATWKQRGLNPSKAMAESLTKAWTTS
jgi:transposase